MPNKILGIHMASIGDRFEFVAKVRDTCMNRIYAKLTPKPKAR